MAETEYIEREELINRLEDAKEKLMNNTTMSSLMAVVVNDIYINFIKEYPIADVVEVRHGHWIEEYDCGYITPHCSECGKTALTKEETSYDYVYSSYCPRCGAKMDKTEKRNS